jgi:hypothetical protein
MKATGTVAGIPDTVWIKDGRVYGLEIKAAGGRLSDAQRQAQAALRTGIETGTRDAAIAASLLLQFGCPAETIRHALTRNADGSAAGPLGRLLDMLANDQPSESGS